MARYSEVSSICGDYGDPGVQWCNKGRDYFFESADGSSTKFNLDIYRGGVTCMKNGQNLSRSPGPPLRVLYFRAPSEPASACEMSGMRPPSCDSRTDANAPECMNYGSSCDVSGDGTADYEVTTPDGTWMRLERKGADTLVQRGWIRNFDRDESSCGRKLTRDPPGKLQKRRYAHRQRVGNRNCSRTRCMIPTKVLRSEGNGCRAEREELRRIACDSRRRGRPDGRGS
jgi:hypothetical protein